MERQYRAECNGSPCWFSPIMVNYLGLGEESLVPELKSSLPSTRAKFKFQVLLARDGGGEGVEQYMPPIINKCHTCDPHMLNMTLWGSWGWAMGTWFCLPDLASSSFWWPRLDLPLVNCLFPAPGIFSLVEVDVQCCVNFHWAAKWFSYPYISILF